MKDKFKSCCFTGYRPQKFPFELKENNREYVRFENKLYNAVFAMPDEAECYTFYCGLAMGFDIIAAECVLLLRDVYPKAKISLICVVPFLDQAKAFPKDWKKRYDEILEKADRVILISDNYFSGCYRKRNEFLVDKSDFVITWFDGKSGGTKNTLAYAKNSGKKIINLNGDLVHEYIYEDDYEIV